MAHGLEPFASETAGFDYFETAAHHARLANEIYNHLVKTKGIALVTGNSLPNSAAVFDEFTSLGGHSTIIECSPEMTLGDLMSLYAASLETRSHFVDGDLRWPIASAQTSQSGAVPILVLEEADRLSDDVLVELNLLHADPSCPLLVLLGAQGFIVRLKSAAPDVARSESFAHFRVQHLAPDEIATFIDYQIGASRSSRAVFRPEIIDLISTYADGDPATVNGLAQRIFNAARSSREDPVGPMPGGLQPEEVVPEETAVQSKPALADTSGTGEGRGAVLDDPISEFIQPEAAVTMALQSGSAGSDEQPSAADRYLGAAPVLLPSDAESEYSPLCLPLYGTVHGGEGRAEEVETVPDPRPESGWSEISVPNNIDPTATRAFTSDDIAPVGGESSDFDGHNASGPDIDDSAVQPARGSEIAAVSQTVGGETSTKDLDDGWDNISPVADFARPSHAGRAHRGGHLVSGIAACLAVLIASSGALFYVLDAERPQSAEPVSSATTSVPESVELRPIPVAQALDKPPAATAPVTVPAPPVAAVISALKDPEQAIGGSGTTMSSGPIPPKPLDKAKPWARPIESVVAPEPLPAEPAKTDVKAKEPTVSPRESVAMVEPPTTVRPANPTPELAKPEAPAAAAVGADEIALLLQRGDQLLSTGDIASARRFFERAADRGDSAAATRLAKTYDPLYLQQSGVRGVFGDPRKAITWYRKGISGGDIEAEMRLQQLRAKFPE
jgi:hypothetical protein